MESFDISGNELTSIPVFLCHLINLRFLGLAENKLTKLPDAFERLQRLEFLNLSNSGNFYVVSPPREWMDTSHGSASRNNLASLPNSIGALTSLRELYLHGNDALGLPPEVLGPTLYDVIGGKRKPAKIDNILEYYFRARIGKRPLNEAKLILVGRGGVGKTSLVNRLLFDRFDKDEKKTEGICISEWKLRLRDSDEVRMNLWDFGGQEIMHATHQFFLTQRSLYLLVLEGRQGAEDADAEYWLKLIESFGTESSGEVSPVLVVLNKTKENPFDLNRRGLQQKYPFICSFVATDCKDRTGLKELRSAIERETDQLKHLRAAFPASWFAIKDKLAGTKKNFITFDDYRKLCSKNGEKQDSGQDSLATHLHNLGIALNYKDDARLRDTHVLNPRWVTDGIYKILNAPLLA
ncbi:MAG: ADP-ribosylation factor-like protein, partial [Nitrososphaera sp.]|nr:ADP-ribosylation factor-like protein [Nitrososphaera sp.]